MRFLIDNIFYASAMSSISMFALFVVVTRQRAVTPLGRWLNAFFFSNFLLTGLISTSIFLTRYAGSPLADTPFRYVIILGFYVVPISLAISGIMIIKWSVTGEPAQNQRSQYEKGYEE